MTPDPLEPKGVGCLKKKLVGFHTWKFQQQQRGEEATPVDHLPSNEVAPGWHDLGAPSNQCLRARCPATPGVGRLEGKENQQTNWEEWYVIHHVLGFFVLAPLGY